MAKPKPIVINNFQKGIAPSAYLGFEEIRGLNITKKPGVVYPNKALTKESSTTVDDLIEGGAFDTSGNFFGYTRENGNSIFKRNTSGTWSEITGFTNTGITGIIFWKGYWIVIHANGTLDASTDGSSWTNAFDTATNGGASLCPIIDGQDNKLYFGNGNVIDRLVEDTTFNPASGATWTLTNGALDLPAGFKITTMTELGSLLMIGTKKDGDGVANIYPWDRSFTSFELPIRIQEDGVNHLITVDNLMYIQAGKKTKWFRSNGTVVSPFAQVPTTMIDLTTNNLEIWENSATYSDDLIYFGVNMNDASVTDKLGVYSLNPVTGAINYEHIISAGETGANSGVRIGCLATIGGSTNSNLIVAWEDVNGSAFGADDIGSTAYASDKAFLISSFMRVGTKYSKETFDRVEVQLAKPLAADDVVKVSYRTAQNGSWTAIGTMETDGDQSANFPFGQTLENLQVKVSLDDEAELIDVTFV